MRGARLAALAAAVVACGACTRSDEMRPLAAGDAAPAYGARGLEGDSLSLTQLRGNAVLLNIWATWCIPCRQEMPALDSLQRAYAAKGLKVVGVSIDEAGADDAVREFLRERGIGFTILRDPDERVTRSFRTSGVPESFLLDRQGRIVRRWIGAFQPAAAETRTSVERALGARG
ncbi:MAG TPA: TlpA disulfide reductase family protein [Longimicrobiales bacterium]|nr:TlpA disulfide reductase family protein [Longimicrobiales bacterium]